MERRKQVIDALFLSNADSIAPLNNSLMLSNQPFIHSLSNLIVLWLSSSSLRLGVRFLLITIHHRHWACINFPARRESRRLVLLVGRSRNSFAAAAHISVIVTQTGLSLGKQGTTYTHALY